jgi:ActR/RegA family two-component response regulator
MLDLLENFWADDTLVEIVVSTGYGTIKGTICAVDKGVIGVKHPSKKHPAWIAIDHIVLIEQVAA